MVTKRKILSQKSLYIYIGITQSYYPEPAGLQFDPLTRLLTNDSHPRSGTFVGSLAHVGKALEDPDSAMLPTRDSKERHEGGMKD